MEIFFKTITIVVIISVIVYAFFISEAFRKGPVIEIEIPIDNSTVESPVTIKGSILNASYASINDRVINTKINGDFSEVVPLPSGYNILKIYTRDDRGKETIEYIDLIVKEIK